MNRLGRNQGGYFGETVDIQQVLRETLGAAVGRGWKIETLTAAPGIELPVLSRPPSCPADWSPRLYISTGIHGDEPAGPLAVRRLIEQDRFPEHAWIWCCPCLNPTGFARHSRNSGEDIDLNRDYRHRRTREIRAHVAWLEHLPLFDLALCLHEDWEAAGFYVYELNPGRQPSLAEVIIEAVRDVCPIDQSPVIDGREARGGIVRPAIDPANRPEWPEALYLIQHKARLSYTLEAPSDFALPVRVAALETGVRAALRDLGDRPRPSPSP